MVMLLGWLGCAAPVGTRDPWTPPTTTAPPTGDTGGTGVPTHSATVPPLPHSAEPPAHTGTVPGGPCPSDMVDVQVACIDRYEAFLVDRSPYDVPVDGVAANALGAVPQGYVSQVVASSACAAAGKRLCSLSEWMRACQGPDGRTYPYGDTYDPAACNDTRPVHPVVELFGAATDWSTTQMNDPRLNQLDDSLDPSGANPGCASAEGVMDLHGNLHEWIDDPAGTFKGGFYVDAVLNGPGCTYTTTAHTVTYHDYSTGFRCCLDRAP